MLPLHIVQQFLFHNIVDSYYKSRSTDQLELKCILLIWFDLEYLSAWIQLAWVARRRYFAWRNNLFMTITMCVLYYVVSVTNDHEYVPFVVITIQFFPHSWLNTGFVTRVTWRCHMWNRNCLPFRSTRVHTRYLMGFVLLDL